MMQKIALIFTIAFTASSALADQCAWNDKSTATVTRAFLAYYPGLVYTYCEPCGDTVMKSVYIGYDYDDTKDGRAIHFRQQEKQTESGDVVWQFSLNEAYASASKPINRDLDLAYTYVKTPDGDYVNLGARMTCLNNKFWNPNKEADFSGLPSNVSPWIPAGSVEVVEDVTEMDFFKSHAEVYPNKPQG